MRKMRACGRVALVLLVCGLGMAEAADEFVKLVKLADARGGLVVHLGCGEGQRTAELAADNRCLVQGLDTDAAQVQAARALLFSKGIYGRASVRLLEETRLPYVDNLVSLLIIEELGDVPMSEVLRVLSPGGEAYLRNGDSWNRTIKARPTNLDDWTHFLYDPSNNAVSKDDVVAPPVHEQWVAGPDTERSHDHIASLSTAVSCGGRLFYVVDEAPILSVKLPPQWRLVARDAFNGVVLWTRELPDWQKTPRGPRDVTSDLARKLVALGNRVYVSPGQGEPVLALDAATGETLQTYAATQDTEEILCDGTWLYVMTRDAASEAAAVAAQRRGETSAPKRGITVVDVKTGKRRWRKCDADTADMMLQTLCAGGGSVFYQNGFEVICLDGTDGRVKWRSDRPANHKGMTIPTLVVSGDLVFSADNVAPGREKLPEPAEGMDPKTAANPMPSELIVYSAKNGTTMWSCGYAAQFFSHVDVFATESGIWTGNWWGCLDQGYTELRNPMTGDIIRRRPADQAVYGVGCPHHRCYKNRASKRYILTGRSGVEFFDSATGETIPNHWIRGTCQYGILPANGLLYVPPHPCACYIEAKVVGFHALAPRAAEEPLILKFPETRRLEKGPAFGAIAAVPAATNDWPTYRHDNARSGMASTLVPAPARKQWSVKLAGRISAPVVAAGRVFVAASDAHTVHALDSAKGTRLWAFTAGGRITSPPTYHDGSLLFGCNDGWVYCLGAADGRLAWRFQAAPEERFVVAYDQLESAWPVHGSVLVRDGIVHFAAGRSSYLDGGVFYYRLEANTGKLLSTTRLDNRDPRTGYQPLNAVAQVGFDMEGALPDILSYSDGLVYMRHTGFDADGKVTKETKPHIFNAAGFLGDNWFHRTYMIISTRMASGFVDWAWAGNATHAGEILVADAQGVYGFRRNEYGANGSHPGLDRTRYRLFAAKPKLRDDFKLENIRVPKLDDSPSDFRWIQEVPLVVRAMTVTPGVVWSAGPVGSADLADGAATEASLQGNGPGLLTAVSSADGKDLAQLKLPAAPVYDGLAAAGGNLYLSLLDGSLVCFAGDR